MTEIIQTSPTVTNFARFPWTKIKAFTDSQSVSHSFQLILLLHLFHQHQAPCRHAQFEMQLAIFIRLQHFFLRIPS